MEITVDISDFVSKMTADLNKYNDMYQKTVKVYQEKHQEYNAYLKKMIDTVYTGEDMEKLKPAPHMPYWDGKKYAEIISALGAHTNETIQMTANEFNQTRDALIQSNLDIGTAFASMNTVTYR